MLRDGWMVGEVRWLGGWVSGLDGGTVLCAYPTTCKVVRLHRVVANLTTIVCNRQVMYIYPSVTSHPSIYHFTVVLTPSKG